MNAEVAVDSVNTGDAQRDTHIKSTDFFAVEQYPVAIFTSTGVRSNGHKYALNGQFTLKGVTKGIGFALEFYDIHPGMGHGEVAGFENSAVVDHKDFGIGGELPLESGGVTIGDKVTITLNIEAFKQG